MYAGIICLSKSAKTAKGLVEDMEKIEMEAIEVSIVDILKMLLKRWWIILISSVLCAVALYMYSTLHITPMYGLTVQFYVAPEFGNSQTTTAATAYQTYTYAREALKTYMELLDSGDFFDKLEENLEGKCRVDYRAGNLSSMISYKEESDTDLFNATIVSAYPSDAYAVAVELAALAPERIHEIKGFDALKVTNQPKYERVSRVNNVTSRNTFVGALFGAIVSALILIVIKVFDVRICDENDLIKMYDVPMLGVIPNFDEVIKDNKKSTYGGRYGESSKK